MLRHDFVVGIARRLGWLLLPLGIFIVIAASNWEYFSMAWYWGAEQSFGAYILCLFDGGMPADFRMQDFSVPIKWVIVQTGCLLYTAEYPSRDLESSYGMQVLVRGGSRQQWWYAKCVWNSISVCMYYAVIYLAAYVYCACFNIPLTLTVSGETLSLFIEVEEAMVQGFYTGKQLFPLMMLMPVFSMIGISFVQMIVGVIWHPVYGFGMGLFFLIWSSFSQTSLAIGNFAMMQRCNLFSDNGLSFSSGLWVILVYIITTIVLGSTVMRRRDILKLMNLSG